MYSMFAVIFLSILPKILSFASTEIYVNTGPSLIQFDLDLNYGEIILTFDQLVQAKYLNLSLITMKPDPLSSTIFSLTNGAFNNLTAQGNTTSVQLFLDSDDFARLVLEPNLATSPLNTFISLASGAIFSIFDIPSLPINSLQVTDLKLDDSPPYVTKFAFSMNTGELTLDFSEPIDISTFMLEGLAFQAQKNSLHENLLYVPLKNYSQQPLISLNYQRTIIIQIGNENLNSLKQIPRLCTNAENTFLSAWKPFVRDFSKNLLTIQSFQRIFGMKVEQYESDSTSPTLNSWDLNLNSGQIILHFTEPLLMSLFNYSGVLLCNGNSLSSSNFTMRVSHPIVTSYLNTEDPIVQLNADQFNLIKYHLNFGIDTSNTFLILEPYLAVDTSEVENRYQGLDATILHSRVVSNLTTDSISPDLVSAKLDLTSRTLTLTFSEIINIESLRIDEFVLQSSPTITSRTEVFQLLPTNPILSLEDTDSVVIGLNESFTSIKSFSFLGRSTETTFVAYTYRFLQDQNGNNVVEIPTNRARMINEFIADTNDPFMKEWTIDMGRNEMVLTFNEPIDTQTFNLSALQLQNRAIVNRATTIQSLSMSSQVVRVGNDLRISLSRDDANNIKRHPNLCTTSDNCFIYFQPSIGFDLGTKSLLRQATAKLLEEEGEEDEDEEEEEEEEVVVVETFNAIVPLSTGISPFSFIADRIPPLLEEYDVDLNLGKLYLYFSEPVSTRSIDFGTIKFYDDSSLHFMSLSPYTIVDSTLYSSEMVELTMTHQDYFLLKALPVFHATNKIWFTCSNESFFDYVGNYLNGEMSGTTANQILGSQTYAMVSATNYFPDTFGPTIIGLQTSGYATMTIYFNDVVKLSSINKGKIILSSFEAIKILPLTDATITSTEASSFKVDFSLTSIETQIRKFSPLWTNQKNTYVYLLSGAVQDTSSNSNLGMNPRHAIRKGGALLYFKLNMNDGILFFESAYPLSIAFSTLSATGFTLQNIETNQQYLLNSFLQVIQPSAGYFFSLQMSSNDLENIRQLELVTTPKSLRLIVQTSAIIDPSLNSLNATETLECVQLIPDVTPLSLLYYTLDMSKGYLDLLFNKHVVVDDIDLSKLTFFNSHFNPSHRVNLRNATIVITSPLITSSKWIRVDINRDTEHPSVRDLIHLSKSISLTQFTYLAIDSSFAHDTSIPPNYLPEIIQEFTIQPLSITSDRTSPKLLSFDLDLSLRKLTLTFNEAVDAATIKPTLLKFLASPDRPNTNIYWLSSQTTVSQQTLSLVATSIIILDLSSVDVNNIMLQYPHLCSSRDNTFLSFPTGAARDLAISSNSLQQVFDIYAIQVTEFIPDLVPPHILHYNLSIPSQLIVFYFNEMVNCSATKIDLLSFQSTNFIGTLTQRYSLHSSSSSLIGCLPHDPITRVVSIHIGREDILAIKTYLKLLKSTLSTNLFLYEGAFVDVPGNKILPLVDGHTLLVNDFQGDITSPRLLSFVVTEQLNLILHFNEPMKISSLHIPHIALLDGRPPTTIYNLTTASRLVSTTDSLRELMIYLHTDFDNIFGPTDIFLYQSTSYLSLTAEAITDTAGNPIEPITPLAAINMGPSLVDWELDLNTGLFVIYFSNQVFPIFSPEGMRIQNDEITPTEHITLTTNTLFTPRHDLFLPPNSSFIVTLNSVDMSSLKASPLILNPESIYLYSPAKVTHSVLRNTIVFPLNSTETLAAILVGDFKSDTTGPEISSISLDLNQGIFTILFDEPILGRSFLVNKVSFRSSYRGVSVYLTNHLTDLITNNSSMLAINLTTGDLNALKSSHYQAALDEVVLESFFVIDLFGNAPFNGIDQVVSLSIVQDATPPVLTSCSFDLSTSIFNIYFDEIVDVSFIRTPTIRLSSSPFIGAYNLTLSNYSIVENYSSQSQRESNVSLNLALFREDSFRLQAHPTIGKLSNTTYIFLPNIRDLAGNVNPSLQSTQCQIIPDTTSPSLESFDFIQFPGTIQIILYFSEVVSLSSFNCSHFLLLSEPSTSGEIYRPLDCSVVTSQDSRQIQYSFTDPSSFTLIGVSEQSTYLSILPTTNVTDLSGNFLTPISHNDALRVGPRVISYFLDMSIGKLTLIFSKDIDTTPSTPFNGSTIGFYSLSSSKQSRLEESNSFLPYFDNSDDFEFVVVIPINPSDLIQLKSIRVAPSEVYLLMDSLSFVDSNAVSSSPLSTSNELIPTRLISDLDPPVIANITLDFSANILSFLVDEPLDILSFQFNLFVLQSRAGSLISPTLGSHRLTSGIVKQLLNHSFVTLQMVLSDADMTAIKLNEVLIANISTAYLSIGYGGLQDMSRNSLQILPEYARKISQYIPDATPPSLNSFSLNMNTGEMILHFSEPIDYTTVSPQEIVLQSRFSQGSSASIHLSNKTEVFPKNGLAITLTLSDQDILNIKYADNLARKSISTYLTGSAAVAADLAGNPMNPILDGFALLVSTFIADSVRPFILKISLDLSEEVLTVHLSEPVETSSLDISAISILNKAVNSNLFYSFTNSSNQILSSDQFASILEFQLSVSDLNELKSLHPLGSSFQSTYFSVQSLFCKDVYQNPVIPISITSPMQVFEYHQDLVLPRLITSSLDMELEVLLLQYSEAISFHSINISELIIQQTETKRYGNYINLTTCEVMVASDDSLLIVQFDRNTINQMKWKEIGSSASVSYISWSDSFVSDVFGNKLNPLWDGSVLGHHPILPTFYFPDSTSPTPLKWFSDRLSKSLVVIFSEPVNVINCSGLHLLLPSLPQPSKNISFNTCLVQYSDYGTKISINLSQATFLNLTTHEAITLLSKTRSGEVSLVIDNATISDLGNVKNYIRSWTLVETSPDCSPCPEGSFQYSQCTTLDDRVCRPCRSCGHQEWIFEECSPLQDRSCVACSDCRLGTYISSPCEQTKDTQCSQCTKCKDLEFQSRSCLFGLDALCDSCKFCSFGNTTVAKLCRTTSYFAWYEQHCCQNVDGLQVK